MDTIIIVLLVIIIIILVYFLLHNDTLVIMPTPNTYSNSLPITSTAANTTDLTTPGQVVLKQVEVFAPDYPLDEEYYYDPSYFYDPYWWWGGWYSGGHSSYGGGNRRLAHRLPSSGDIVHGGIQPGNIHMGGHMGGARHH